MENRTPMVSVIIPIYNTEKFIEKCVQSVMQQIYQNLDIVLIDDGSTDNSLEIIMEMMKKDSRIRVFSRENHGLVSARKWGIELSKGDLIGFVDSDDWIEPTMYARMVEKYLETGCDLVSSGICRDYVETSKSVILCDNYAEGLYLELEKKIYPTMLYDAVQEDHGLYCTLVNKLYKREILLQVYSNLNLDVTYGEDAMAIYPYCLACKSIYILKEAFYHYIIHSASMCASKDKKLVMNTYWLHQVLYEHFDKESFRYILLRQLREYIKKIEMHNMKMLYNVPVVFTTPWEFSYDDVILDTRVIIYGAGGCGQALYQQLQKKNYASNVVGWVDKNYANKKEECLYEIAPVERVMELEYDYIVIAIKDYEIAQKIKKELIDVYRVEANKIIWNEIKKRK